MIDNDCNILNNMSKTDFRECRSLVIDMVLHTGECVYFFNRIRFLWHLKFTFQYWYLLTFSNICVDMSMHFSQLKHMKGLLSSLATCHHEAVPTCPDKARVLSLLLHTCDVSHPAKTWDLHHQVENKISNI